MFQHRICMDEIGDLSVGKSWLPMRTGVGR